MLFVDGENLTMRGQKLAESKGHNLTPGPWYRPDILLWPANMNPTNPADSVGTHNRLRDAAVRAYYYTSLVGDESVIWDVKLQLRACKFSPEVFKKESRQAKAKGVDIALTKDMLSHAFRDNYEIAVLVAGDGDYVPVVEEVQRLGKLVFVLFFENEGLNPKLKLAADNFCDFTPHFLRSWGIS
jgi:hypothetical protein